jgi:hypothetical protein
MDQKLVKYFILLREEAEAGSSRLLDSVVEHRAVLST